MNKSVKRKVLLDAAALVRKGWTQERSARDVDGDSCSPTSEFAVSFCMIGAIQRVSFISRLSDDEEHDISFLVRKVGNLDSIAAWNDDPDRTSEEVAQLLERAAGEVA